MTTTPRHRRHEWSAIREHRTPNVPGRHKDSLITRLGAGLFDTDEFKGLLRDITVGNPFRGAR